MSEIGELLIGIVVLCGALISAVSAFGLIRLPDIYLRSHAATKSSTLGVLLILTGVFLYFMIYVDHISAKLILGIIFVFITAPVAGHLNGRAAYRTGVPLWSNSKNDDLRPALEKNYKDSQQSEGNRTDS